MSIEMGRSRLAGIGALVTITMLVGACAVQRAPDATPTPTSKPAVRPVPEPQAGPSEPLPVDPMAEVAGDKPLPAASGNYERYDCMTGVENQHARIAFEARGGQVLGFSYYSKWKPRTCSIDVQHTDRKLKWRLTPEGAIRVHSPIGVYVIRSLPGAYVFEFQNIQRMKVCGMMGAISGTMTVKRVPGAATCSVMGIMDR